MSELTVGCTVSSSGGKKRTVEEYFNTELIAPRKLKLMEKPEGDTRRIRRESWFSCTLEETRGYY